MDKQIIITKNNKGIELEVQLLDTTKKPINLTGKTIVIDFINPNQEKTILNATIKSAVDGVCSFILEEKQTNEEGLWSTYWKVEDTNSSINTQSAIYYYVLAIDGGVE